MLRGVPRHSVIRSNVRTTRNAASDESRKLLISGDPKYVLTAVLCKIKDRRCLAKTNPQKLGDTVGLISVTCRDGTVSNFEYGDPAQNDEIFAQPLDQQLSSPHREHWRHLAEEFLTCQRNRLQGWSPSDSRGLHRRRLMLGQVRQR